MVVYIFDVDGTLTPPRKPMEESFAKKFISFLKNNKAYIVSGSDYNKLKEQIPNDILRLFEGIFSSMGNELYINDKLIYTSELIQDKNLIEDLTYFRKNTKYPGKLFDGYIDIRKGMLNFAIIGRNCTYAERLNYNKWDKIHREREKICNALIAKYTNYEFFIGGQISIDIMIKGKNKEQAITYLRKIYSKELLIFAGDKTEKGGNDYTIALACERDINAKVITVSSTKDLLSKLKII